MNHRSNKSLRYRGSAALVMLLAVCVYANINLLGARMQVYPETKHVDEITLHEQRIEQIRKFLPPTRALGYVTTVENEKIFLDERNFRNVEFVAQYYLTQYTLAPIFVYNSPKHALVVGNFLDGPAEPARIRAQGLTPLHDFGEGLILYRGEPRR